MCYSKACRLPLEIFSVSSISLRDFLCADNWEQSIADRGSITTDSADRIQHLGKWIQHAVYERHGHRYQNVDENRFVLERGTNVEDQGAYGELGVILPEDL